MEEYKHDFAMEKRLKELDPGLHKIFTDAVFALQFNLSNYKLIFPQFTDHTMLHSMTVIDFCNKLIGDQLEKLNADEIYALLMGCYFHDTGMGITRKDFDSFSTRIDFGDYFDTHSRDDMPRIIRDFHHEFSGQFIRKYSVLFEIPSEEHMQAIIQISRGHRKTDLFDENRYPADFKVPGGNTICLPYLSALIRLADEIDVAASRNPILLYDIMSFTIEKERFFSQMNMAVRSLDVGEKAFTLKLDDSEITDVGSIPASELRNGLIHMVGKMQETLDYCRKVVSQRTPFEITQEKIIVLEED